MKASFPADPVTAAIFFTLLTMGLIGLVVVLPIFCIYFTWNSAATYISFMPAINAWQSVLLYLAGVALIYLSGIISITIDTEHAE